MWTEIYQRDKFITWGSESSLCGVLGNSQIAVSDEWLVDKHRV